MTNRVPVRGMSRTAYMLVAFPPVPERILREVPGVTNPARYRELIAKVAKAGHWPELERVAADPERLADMVLQLAPKRRCAGCGRRFVGMGRAIYHEPGCGARPSHAKGTQHGD